mgnify:CR=1 FL=1
MPLNTRNDTRCLTYWRITGAISGDLLADAISNQISFRADGDDEYGAWHGDFTLTEWSSPQKRRMRFSFDVAAQADDVRHIRVDFLRTDPDSGKAKIEDTPQALGKQRSLLLKVLLS